MVKMLTSCEEELQEYQWGDFNRPIRQTTVFDAGLNLAQAKTYCEKQAAGGKLVGAMNEQVETVMRSLLKRIG